MGWINLGDVSPRQGTLLMREGSAEIASNGDFSAEVVEVIPETHNGGRDRVFRLCQGDVFLSAEWMLAALESVGARLEGDALVVPGPEGQDVTVAAGTPGAEAIMVMAGYGFAGIDGEDVSCVVSIGLPGHMDPDPVFGSPERYYPERTSLWAVMRDVFDGFDHPTCPGSPFLQVGEG